MKRNQSGRQRNQKGLLKEWKWKKCLNTKTKFIINIRIRIGGEGGNEKAKNLRPYLDCKWKTIYKRNNNIKCYCYKTNNNIKQNKCFKYKKLKHFNDSW